MIIGLRGGHSKNCVGAIGIVKEYEQMQSFYKYVAEVLTEYGHTVIDCNSNAASQAAELKEGADKANNAKVDLFISLHMNAFNGEAYGTECVVSSEQSSGYNIAKKICENFSTLGFKNRGVKFKWLYEMNNIKCGNIIFEICFADSAADIAIYNKYSWIKLAHTLCNAIDRNIPLDKEVKVESGKGYIVTNYLPPAYADYTGVDIQKVLEQFEGVKCYVKGNLKGVWIETQYLTLQQCEELKNKIGSLCYEIKS